MAQDSINEEGYDLSVNQLILLINLSRKPDSSQVQLSELIFKDFASVARMVDLLVKKGYLKRTENPQDRRRKDLTPTQKCNEVLQKIVPIIETYRAKAIAGLSEDEVDTLSQLLNKVEENCLQSNVDQIIE